MRMSRLRCIPARIVGSVTTGLMDAVSNYSTLRTQEACRGRGRKVLSGPRAGRHAQRAAGGVASPAAACTDSSVRTATTASQASSKIAVAVSLTVDAMAAAVSH
jgi:hypothetical protein